MVEGTKDLIGLVGGWDSIWFGNNISYKLGNTLNILWDRNSLVYLTVCRLLEKKLVDWASGSMMLGIGILRLIIIIFKIHQGVIGRIFRIFSLTSSLNPLVNDVFVYWRHVGFFVWVNPLSPCWNLYLL